MSQHQLLAKRIGLVALTNLLVELNTLIMLPLLTKNLPASEYGVWVQISVTIGLIPAVALLGLPYSMVRFLPSAKGRENIREIFYSMAVIIAIVGLAAAVAIFLLSVPIASAIFDGRQTIGAGSVSSGLCGVLKQYSVRLFQERSADKEVLGI